MRFAFVSGLEIEPWGGSEELWSQAAMILLAQGHEVLVSAKAWTTVPEAIRQLQAHGATVMLRKEQSSNIPQRAFRYVLRKIAGKTSPSVAAVTTGHELARFSPALVCISNGAIACGLELTEAIAQRSLPYVTIVQANAEHLWPDDKTSNRLASTFTNAAHCFFVSNANRELLESQLAVHLENASIIRNPFNLPRAPEVTWPNLTPSIKLACVARLYPPAKGQDLILRVMAKPKWQNRSLTVSFFGRGPMENGLKRLASLLKIESKVAFHGHVGDIAEIWRQHHALILPSRFEGLPLALVEACLCSRLAIASNVAGIGELVTDNLTGFLAGSPTVDALDEAMERAWNRQHEWQIMGAKAKKAATEMIPHDPAAVFAHKLIEIAARTQATAPGARSL